MAAWRQTGNESGYKMDGLENGSDGLNSDRYFETVARWLALEGDAERQRMAERRRLMHAGNAERSGETIVNLRLTDNKIGLAGRLLLDLEKPGAAPLPMNRLKVGSPIVVTSEEETGDEGVPGVVSRRRMNSIQVAVERWPENGRLRLDLSPDETTRRRQLAAMGAARRARGASARLRDILLEIREPRFDARRRSNS